MNLERPKSHISEERAKELLAMNNPQILEGIDAESLANLDRKMLLAWQAALVARQQELETQLAEAQKGIEDIGKDEGETSIESDLGEKNQSLKRLLEESLVTIKETITSIEAMAAK